MRFAAGVLLYKRYNGKVWLLLGKENNQWSAFAGGYDKNESARMCASREFHEETCNVFKDLVDCTPGSHSVVDAVRNFRFTMFFVEYSYEIDLNTNEKFQMALETCTDEHMKEKSEIRWFEKSVVANLNLRPNFKRQLGTYLKEISNL